MPDDIANLERISTTLNRAFAPIADDLIFRVVGMVTTDGLVLVDIRSRLPAHDGESNIEVKTLRDKMALLLRDAMGCEEGDMIRLSDVTTKA
jgi:hypothetical protein